MNIPTNLIPRSDLSLAQRMLATGAAPDLIVQAIDEGLFDGVDLNKTIETIPLSEMWARKTVLPSPMIYESFESKMGVIPDLDWPVDTDPSQIRTIGERKEGDESWVNQAMEVLWVEHAAIRLVKSGMDPLQPWSINKKAWQTHYENLLDWASKTGRPWLLKTCLESLHSEVRTLEAKRSVYGPNSRKEEVIGTRLHEAMNHHLPLVAEVWRQAGADIHARNSTGETPIFLARSCHAIEWALKHGANLGDISNEGAAPQDAWRKRAINVEEWSRMTKVAKLSEGRLWLFLGKRFPGATWMDSRSPLIP